MEVIILSSDSEEDDSSLKIIAEYSNFLSRTDPLPYHNVEFLPDAPKVNAPVVSPHPNLNSDLWKVYQKTANGGDCYLPYS